MEQVDIRLAGPDDQDIDQIRREIVARIPGATFDRVCLGQSGDWLCHGAVAIDTAVDRHEPLVDALAWLNEYKKVRTTLANLTSLSRDAMRILDQLVEDCEARVTRQRRDQWLARARKRRA